LAKVAVRNAYRDLPSDHCWSYYNRRGMLTTSEPYATGTIAYDHCVTPEHEALTRSGWKKHGELSVGEEIMAYDPETGRTAWRPIQKIHRSYYTGRVLEVYRSGVPSLRCTENHKFPAMKRIGRGRGTPGRLISAGFVLACNLTREHNIPLAAPCENGCDSPLTPRQAAILGWAVTDGHGLLDRGRNYGSRITQSVTANRDNCNAIELLTGSKQCGPYENANAASWAIPAAVAAEIREVITKTADLPSLVSRLSTEAASAMYDAMLAAEGSCTAAGRLRFTQWHAKRKPIAEAFQVLCLMLGKPANFRERRYSAGVRYDVTVRTSKHFKPVSNSRWTVYRGLVWCPQVEPGAWVCRCNGYVSITGNSGGASERLVTLTSGTWPTWARYGTLLVDGKHCKVATRESGSLLTLDAVTNPGEDIAAGTAYQLYRSVYPLPNGFRRIGTILDPTSVDALFYVTPNEIVEEHIVDVVPGTPRRWTLRGLSADYPGQVAIEFHPPPAEARTYEFLYANEGRDLLLPLELDAGTVSVDSGGTTVTGSGTGFTADCVGAVIRFSASTTIKPTALWAQNPYVHQAYITARASSTSLTIDTAAPSALSGVQYIISDPIDVEPNAMMTYFLAKCEYELAKLLREPAKELAAMRERLRMELREAAGADGRRIELQDAWIKSRLQAYTLGDLARLEDS
jgi:hypothetical protein